MKNESFKTPEQLASYVGEYWKDLQNKNDPTKQFLVASPLSSTPLVLYSWMIQNAQSLKHWSQFRFVLMDEQLEGNDPFFYVPLTDTASYERFAREKFLDRLSNIVDLPLSENILKPELDNLAYFDDVLSQQGGIDLLILAIGVQGHYAQVMPGTTIDVGFHIPKLIPELAEIHTKVGSKSYEGASFRQYGMSLGPRQVLEAKHVIVMITGESKRELTKQLLSYDSFDPNFPLSIIHHQTLKNNVQLLLSKEVLG